MRFSRVCCMLGVALAVAVLPHASAFVAPTLGGRRMATAVAMEDLFGDKAYTVTLTAEKESPVAASEEDIVGKIEGPLDLTWENVDKVLDEMRPYLIQDGGNVIITAIEGTVVKLELQGECGTCPSSTQTMKMGLERGLLDTIPEITEVVQDNPKGPDVDAEQVNIVLENVRPALMIFDSAVDLVSIQGAEDSLQPTVTLKMSGSAAMLDSTKKDLAQRMQKHFLNPGLRVEFQS